MLVRQQRPDLGVAQKPGHELLKHIAVLKSLLALGGRDVPEARLADKLWPGSEADAAHEALAVNLHRLRKLLGSQDAVDLRDGRISLNPEMCWVDAWTFESLVEQSGAPQGTDDSRNPPPRGLRERDLAFERREGVRLHPLKQLHRRQ